MRTSDLMSGWTGRLAVVVVTGSVLLSACKKEGCTDPAASNYDPDAEKDNGSCLTASNEVTAPSTYAFTRDTGNGAESTVSFSGQTDRLNQLEEITAYLKTGDAGGQLDARQLRDMFANTNDNGNGHFSFTSTKQLQSKTFSLDTGWFTNLFELADVASDSGHAGVTAASGTAGLAARGSGSTILVDANGREFTQLIEKGLMGATFLNQIFNTYLTDDRIGDAVDNTNLVAGKNYASAEHHMDEAFGYVGAPVDFVSSFSGTGHRFWAKYSNNFDALVGFNNLIMDAFKTARAAIVAKNSTVRNAQRDILYQQLERLTAAAAIHYANEALSATNDGDRLHVLSECYAFTRALRYAHSSYRALTQAQVDDLLNVQIGTNFWETTTTGLNNVKSTLAAAYDLESVKDDL